MLLENEKGKYFSNGFDTEWAKSTAASKGGSAYEHLVKLSELYGPVVEDFISLPMPTIAAVTGHAAAAGLMLPMSHDYVLMRKDRAVMYLSELDWGKCPFPSKLASLARIQFFLRKKLQYTSMYIHTCIIKLLRDIT